MNKDAKSPAVYNRIQERLLTLKYQTSIKVDGVGEYEIEMTNVIDTRTFQEKPLMPTLLSVANVQKTKAARMKRLMI